MHDSFWRIIRAVKLQLLVLLVKLLQCILIPTNEETEPGIAVIPPYGLNGANLGKRDSSGFCHAKLLAPRISFTDDAAGIIYNLYKKQTNLNGVMCLHPWNCLLKSNNDWHRQAKDACRTADQVIGRAVARIRHAMPADWARAVSVAHSPWPDSPGFSISGRASRPAMTYRGDCPGRG